MFKFGSDYQSDDENEIEIHFVDLSSDEDESDLEIGPESGSRPFNPTPPTSTKVQRKGISIPVLFESDDSDERSNIQEIMDIIFEPEISLEKSLILFANYFQFDFGIREIQLVKSYGLSYKDSMLIIYSIILDHLAAENEANWVRQMISNTEIHGTLINHIRQFLK